MMGNIDMKTHNKISSDIHSNQAGVSWIVAMAFILLGMYGALVFGFIPAIQRASFLEMQALADKSCGFNDGATGGVPLPSDMWARFNAFLDTNATKDSTSFLKPRRSILKTATLYLSTPIEGTGVTFQGALNRGVVGNYDDIAIPTNPISPASPRQIQVTNTLQAEVQIHYGFDGVPLPAGSFNQIKNQGNTAVCVFEAEIDPKIFGIPLSWLDQVSDFNGNQTSTREFQVVAASWAPATGVNSSPPLPVPANTTDPLTQEESPGLIIAIAPQIPDMDNDVQSDFDQKYIFSSAFADLYDFDVNPPSGTSSPKNSFRFRSTGNSDPFLAGLDALNLNGSNSKFIERRISCLNPLSYVRNRFTARLAGLAARHGQYRWTTEVMMVNSRVEGINPAATEVIPPVMISRGSGSDIGDSDNETFLPYLFGKFPVTGAAGSRWVVPFRLAGTVADDNNKRDRIISAQLVDCAHMYAGMAQLENDASGYFSENNLFEPDEFVLDNEFSDFKGYTLSPEDWRSREAPSLPKTLLTIGSARVCPYFSDTEFPHSGPDDVCLDRNTFGSFRIVPDLRGLFVYANRFSIGSTTPKYFAADTAGATTPTGTPPFFNNGDITGGFPYTDPPSNIPLNPNIALILHDFPTNIDLTQLEVRQVNDGVRENGDSIFGSLVQPPPGAIPKFTKGVRPIITFAFPSNDISTIDLSTRITNYRTLMNIATTTGEKNLNQLIIIEPCMIELSGTGANSTRRFIFPNFCDSSNPNFPVIKSANGTSTTPSEILREFWEALVGLSPGIPVDYQIDSLADRYFRMYLLNKSELF